METISAGALGIEVEFQKTLLNKSLNEIENEVRKRGKEIERAFSKVNPNIQTSLLKKTLSEIKTMQTELQRKLDEKIKLNVDYASIARTRSALNTVTEALQGVEKEKVRLASTGTFNLDKVLSYGTVVLAARALHNMVDATIETTAEFESLQTRLVSLYGDVGKANVVFEKFNKIAETTPYSLRQIVEAGATLKSFGMDAEDTIKPVSDLAAYMGMDVVEAASAMGRAFAGGVGAADVLRERGVLNLVKSFKGIEDLSKLTLPEFRRALIETMVDPTAGIIGSTDRLSKTYQGALSNMKDSVDKLKVSFGQLFVPLLTEFFPKATEWIKDFTRRVKELAIGRGTVAAESLTFDFTGTTEKERAGMISDWETQIVQVLARLNKAKADFVNYKMNADKLDEVSKTAEVQIASYKKLIQLAKDYKTEKSSKGGDIDVESAKKSAQEKIEFEKKYYDNLKFLSAGFLDYKLQEITKEIAEMKKAGLSELDFETYKTEKKKQLFDEYLKYVSEKSGFTFDKNGQITNGKVGMPLEFMGGKNLSGSSGIYKPKVDFGSDVDIIENWIKGSEAAMAAYDTMFNAFYEGLSQIKIRTSDTASSVEKTFAGMANIVIAEIQRILLKWIALNIISFLLPGGGGVSITKVLGLEKKITSSTPIETDNATAQSTAPASLSINYFSPQIANNSSFNDRVIVERLDRLIGSVQAQTMSVIKGKYQNQTTNTADIIKKLAIIITEQQNDMRRNNIIIQ